METAQVRLPKHAGVTDTHRRTRADGNSGMAFSTDKGPWQFTMCIQVLISLMYQALTKSLPSAEVHTCEVPLLNDGTLTKPLSQLLSDESCYTEQGDGTFPVPLRPLSGVDFPGLDKVWSVVKAVIGLLPGIRKWIISWGNG